MTRLLLAAGHGRRPDGTWDQGASHARPGQATIVEHTENEEVLFECEARLRAAGFFDYALEKGATSNANDRLDGNWAAFRTLVNAGTGVALAVEIHHDYDKAARGGFGIIPKRTGYDNAREWRAVRAIEAAWMRRGIPQRPSYEDRRGLGLIRRPKFPTLIWECDRLGVPMTAPADSAAALAEGILAYLDWAPAPPPPQPPQEDTVGIVVRDPRTGALLEVTEWKGRHIGTIAEAQALLAAGGGPQSDASAALLARRKL